MYNITLVFTHHSEIGKCNAEELYKIIDEISPEVIFEELPKDLYDRIYKLPRHPNEPPETASIKRYLLNHDISHIPVDINPSQTLSKEEIGHMLSFFQKYQSYKELEAEQYKLIGQKGFAFLNSEKCMMLFEEKMILEERLMCSSINRSQLNRIHKLFYDEHSIRETEMLNNIYNYSVENQYTKAIFFIGSGHRISISKKIEEIKTQSVKLNWGFYKQI